MCQKIGCLILASFLSLLFVNNANGQEPWTQQGTASGVSYNLSHLVYIDEMQDPPQMTNHFLPGQTVVSAQEVEVHNTTQAKRKVMLEVRLYVWNSHNAAWEHFGTLSESRTLPPGGGATIDHIYDYLAPAMPLTPERIKYTVRLEIQNNFVVGNDKEVVRHH